MMTLSNTWIELFTLSGLLNPFALLVGGVLGWYANKLLQVWIAGFAAAAMSLIVETGLSFLPIPQIISHDAGALAMFPFRFLGGVSIFLLIYFAKSRFARARN